MTLDPKYLAIFVFLFAVLFQELVLYFLLPMLANSGAVRQNYRGDYIPVAAGISFSMTVLAAFILIQLSDSYGGSRYTLYLLALVVITLLGLLDDVLGQRDTLGFKGHFTKLFLKRELTTGGLKALGGGAIAAYISLFYSATLWEFLLNVMVIGLFTNSMNLFDLRPGRCVKVFILFFIPLLWLSQSDYLIFLPLFGAVLTYFPYDLKAQVMMGDSGSNVLGMTLGIMAVYGLDIWSRAGLVVFLVLLHLFAEKYSITAIIEKYKFLKVLDRLGRSD